MGIRKFSVFTLLLLLLTTFFVFSQRKAGMEIVKNGVADLSSFAPGDEPVGLDGEWQFYPQITNLSILYTLKPNIENVPGIWETNHSHKGRGVYRVSLKMPRAEGSYGIYIRDIRSAFQIYIDGDLVQSCGYIGTGYRTEKPDSWKGIIPVQGKSGQIVELLIVVSNFNSRKGGILKSLDFGDIVTITNKQTHKYQLYFLLFGAFVMIGLYNFSFFVFRREEKASLYFSILCFSLALRVILFNYIGLYGIIPFLGNIPWEVLKKMEYISFHVIVWSYVFYFNAVLAGKYNKIAAIITMYISIFSVIPILLFPYRIFNELLIYYQGFMIIMGLYVLAATITKAIQGRSSSFYFLAAFVVIFTASVLDVLSNQLILSTPPVSFGSFFLFIFIQSLVLSHRFTNLINNKENLSRDLNKLLTERRRYEVILKNRVEERTRELTDAMQEAHIANRAKSDFLAKMSHEIRTPLNGIMGFAEIISETPIPEEKEKYSSLIVEESEKLLTLLNQLLDLSKVDAGGMGIEKKPFEMGDLVQSIDNIFTPRAEGKGLEFSIKSPEIKDLLVGDPFRLRQVLVNLLGNSLKFTKEGFISLNITVTFDTAEEIGLLFTVKDSGIGIKENKMKDIFKEFSQADNSITREFGGTGLGTSISQALVKLMGGSIGVESSFGQGSVFWFDLRFPRIARPESFKDQGEIKFNYKKMELKVLLAEDYPANQQVATRHLEKAGCRVSLAENGVQAVELFRKEPFDVICMDIHMPEMDGYQATRLIRKAPDGEKVIILGLTADAYEESKIRALDAGMNDVLTKPLHRASFLEAVAKWTGSRAEMDIDFLLESDDS